LSTKLVTTATVVQRPIPAGHERWSRTCQAGFWAMRGKLVLKHIAGPHPSTLQLTPEGRDIIIYCVDSPVVATVPTQQNMQ